MCQSVFLSCNFIKKEALAHGCFCEFCKIFRSSFFTEYIRMTASILQQLLALYFAITYSWQLSSSEKALVGKKFIHLSQYIYIYIYLFFVIFFDKCLFTLSVSDCLLYSEQTTGLLAWRHLNTMTDPVIICIYLRITERHFRDQGNVHYSTKSNLVQTSTFWNTSLQIFTARSASFV